MIRKWMMLALAALLLPACAAGEGAEMQLLAINVGKADCLLLQCGESVYMIDTGEAESWGAVSSVLRQKGITKLTGVIVTHTDKDHAGGAWALATSSVEVEGWYASRYYNDVKEKKHPVVKAAALRGETVTWLSAGDELPLDGGTLKVIGPISHDESKENNNSVVLLAQAGEGSILLAGDMEFPEEEELLAAGAIPRCTVLKVGNHGESDATSEALMNAVKPKAAVISTNTEAEPDTPAKRVMKLMVQHGVHTAVTQNAEAGVLVTVRGNEAVMDMLQHGELPAVNTAVYLSDKSVAQDAVCLRNGGDAAADLSGWYLYSQRGKETFVFPEGTVIAPGGEITVTSLSSEDAGTLVWPEKNVWHKSKGDTAMLYDVYGRLVSELE